LSFIHFHQSNTNNMPNILHVGCGGKNKSSLPRHFQGEGWQEIRLDIDPQVRPDIVASMLDMQEVADAGTDAVFSSHNLEHLYPHEVSRALAEFRRVLKADGMAVITLPDLQAVAELIAADKLDDPAYVSPAGPIAPLDILYGFRPALARGNLYMAHRTGFTARTLAQALLQAGFRKVALQRQRAALNLWAIAYVGDISEERLIADRKDIFPLPVA
jgi:SAM-dependent methyltransferase